MLRIEISMHPTFLLPRKCLRVERLNNAARSAPAPVAEPATTVSPASNYGQLDDGEGDSIASSDDNDESDSEVLDPNWRVADVTIDSRCLSSMSSWARRLMLVDLFGYQEASPAKYFLHFLPCIHIQQVAIPATNAHARSQRPTWVDITWSEYLTFIMLNINMMIITCHSLESYWEEGTPESFDLPRVNFGKYMSIARFREIKKWHVFTSPSDAAYQQDKLYQVRSFLNAYNQHLEGTMEPGETMCIDESMNQWLGMGMPNLKKVPRKPHSIGQEYKCIADNETCIIMRLEFTGDWLHYARTQRGVDAIEAAKSDH